MLTVTDKAAQYVRETLKKKSAPGAVRIVKTEEGYHLTLDEAREGDQVFEHEVRSSSIFGAVPSTVPSLQRPHGR